MALTMHDTKPIGLCLATQELLDTKRYLLNFCDGLILRGNDPQLKRKLELVKRELNTFRTKQKFLEGHKAVIVSNIDKIIGLVDRYSKVNPDKANKVKSNGKVLIQKVLNADSFDKIYQLESEFKKDITLPIYQMFTNDLKRSNIRMV
ncbi:MAG: hypothetical protein GF368_04620 [Candidatus Aenigmarchaeota archaeon]|nr:hypothetical protein [Candidatus Aenigmarchaeota archaeon]